MIRLQFCWTRLSMFGVKSVSAVDSTFTSVMPRSFLALSRPSAPDWLNDLSSKPPWSETMQPLKLAAALPPDLVALVLSGALAHPAIAMAAMAARLATRIILFTSDSCLLCAAQPVQVAPGPGRTHRCVPPARAGRLLRTLVRAGRALVLLD